MPKKIIPVPSDFARQKPGAYQKKSEDNIKKPVRKGITRSKTIERTAKPYTTKRDKAFIEDDRKPGKERTYAPSSKPKRVPLKTHPTLQTPDERKESRFIQSNEEKMPLNKYIAHCGICSRRDAIALIKERKVKVNDIVETEPGYKVLDSDIILLEDKKITPQVKFVYFLLNKPKDFITTTDDPQGRKTVMDLLKSATSQRIFPVGRLDRNTTGLLLLTNDGELTQKLSHPKHKIRKVYQVGLDKPLKKPDFEAITKGLALEDGEVKVDEIVYINPDDKREIGIEIHVGRNRIVRRIFEHLQYEVKTLDRVIYAGLTKKNLPRGKFRELTAQEVIFLKHFK